MRILQRRLRVHGSGAGRRRRRLAATGLAATLLAACAEPPPPTVAAAPPEPPTTLAAARIDVVDLSRDGASTPIEGRLDPTPAAAAAARLRERFAPSDTPGAVVFAIETARVRATPVAAAATPAGVDSTRYEGLMRLRATLQRPTAAAREARIEARRRLDAPNSWGPLQREQALNAFVDELVADLVAETRSRLTIDGDWTR